ncbi:Immunity protein 32 [Xanthomonas bromi]|uniref:Immunity protein 32 n=1 Tax=Xanthomonas bromi TaxID=56449 RepID=A0A1C3NQ35_9XANT|nr:Imm52 family immunity protein [Xanthomonas bromi]PPV05554.1 hypothetical protein XbrCFBP1976_16755 [Xanthomonas bromi]SBV52502.1 Immunity protein 32 [Xanthomonas bromi]
MNFTMVCRFPSQSLTAEETYEEAARWVKRLTEVGPEFRDWWANPLSPEDHFVAFSDRPAIVSRLRGENDDIGEESSDASPGAGNGILLTNAGNEKDWAKKGKVSLSIEPSAGDLRFGISGAEKLYASPVDIAWPLLKALVSDSRVTLAQTNVKQRVNNELLLYSVDRAPFPHREFLGWMGYLPHVLNSQQVPDAARLERLRSGTLILSTPLLDLSDPQAIKQANQVEMSLVDLDLLPVIDPDLM